MLSFINFAIIAIVLLLLSPVSDFSQYVKNIKVFIFYVLLGASNLIYWLCSILYDNLLVMSDWRISGKHQIIITQPRIKTFRPHKI